MNHPPSDTDQPDVTPDTATVASEYPTTVEDPSTGARITFLERNVDDRGPYLLVEGVLPPGTDGGPARFHPRSEARSEVVDGRAVVTVSGEEIVLLPGESVIIGAGDPHTIRNGDEGPLVVRTTLRPPGGYEAAIRALYDLGAGGRPDPLGIAAVLYRHREDIRLAGVPWRLQRPILRVLAVVARALGRGPA
jgi:mannose-6-phosphate isomerase-like protein (cupin superfamily)